MGGRRLIHVPLDHQWSCAGVSQDPAVVVAAPKARGGGVLFHGWQMKRNGMPFFGQIRGSHVAVDVHHPQQRSIASGFGGGPNQRICYSGRSVGTESGWIIMAHISSGRPPGSIIIKPPS